MSGLTVFPWQPLPREWAIVEGQVLVFRIDLSGEPTAEDQSLLSDDERSKAAQFRFDQHRHRWAICRAQLRRLLGHALDLPPARVVLAYPPQGKPLIPGNPVHFNVSHSHNHALIAIARDAPVGIDVELLNDSADLTSIAERFFTPAERSFVTLGTPETPVTRFYQCWTRKEALMKCLGHGFLESPEEFDVSRTLGSQISTMLGGATNSRYSYVVTELRPSDTSIAALVTDEHINEITLYTCGGRSAGGIAAPI